VRAEHCGHSSECIAVPPPQSFDRSEQVPRPRGRW
jgi:hypothetical protein